MGEKRITWFLQTWCPTARQSISSKAPSLTDEGIPGVEVEDPEWQRLSCVCACMHANLLQSCLFQSYGLQSARLLCPWDSSGMDTGVGCHALLQGIFLTQGSNPRVLCLLHWQMGSLPPVPPGKPGDTSMLIKPNFLFLLDTQLDNMSRPPWHFGRTIWLAEWHIWHLQVWLGPLYPSSPSIFLPFLQLDVQGSTAPRGWGNIRTVEAYPQSLAWRWPAQENSWSGTTTGDIMWVGNHLSLCQPNDQLDGHEFEWTLGVGDRQGGLACCDSWGRKESDRPSDRTELNWMELFVMTVNLPWLIHLAHIDCLLACVLDHLDGRISYASCSAKPHPGSSQEAVFITKQLQEGMNSMWSTPVLNTMGAQKLSGGGRDARWWGMKRAEICNWRMCNSQHQTEHQLASA